MKIIFKVFPCIVLVLLFFSCEKDQNMNIENEIDSKILNIKGHFVKGDSIRQANKELDVFLRTRFERNNAALVEDITSTTYGFTINTSRVLQLTGDNYTNYIFTAYRPNQITTDIIENYMLTVFDTGEYMQVVVAYPMINTNGSIEPSVMGSTLTYINDVSLVTGVESPCESLADEIIGWDANTNCIYIRCTAGGEHSYGESCNGSPSQQPSRVCSGGWVTTGCMSSGGVGGANPTDDPIGGGQNTDDPNTTTTEEVPIVPFVPYWLTVVNCVNDGALGNFNDDLPLSTTDISWLQSQAGSVHANAISDFITDNGCSGNENFIDEAVTAILDGDEVDYTYEIIFDDSFDAYPCQKNIVRETYSACGPTTQLFQDIFEGSPTTHVTFEADYNYTQGLGLTFGSPTGNVNIKFGQPFINATNLLMAITVAHETFHANLEHIYHNLNSDNDPSNDIIITGLMGDPTYGQLVEAWAKTKVDENTPTAHHAYLANYKDLIAQAAYNWAITPTTQNGGGFDSNDTTLLPYLQKLAWSGLHETTLWSSFRQNPLNAVELQETETIIEAERHPFYDNTTPKGAPCL